MRKSSLGIIVGDKISIIKTTTIMDMVTSEISTVKTQSISSSSSSRLAEIGSISTIKIAIPYSNREEH